MSNHVDAEDAEAAATTTKEAAEKVAEATEAAEAAEAKCAWAEGAGAEAEAPINSPLTSVRRLLRAYCALGVVPARMSDDDCSFSVRWWLNLKAFAFLGLSLVLSAGCEWVVEKREEEGQGEGQWEGQGAGLGGGGGGPTHMGM